MKGTKRLAVLAMFTAIALTIFVAEAPPTAFAISRWISSLSVFVVRSASPTCG